MYNYRGVDHYDGQAWSMVPINWVERSHEGRLAMTTLGHAAFGGGPSTGSRRSYARLRGFSSWETVRPRWLSVNR